MNVYYLHFIAMDKERPTDHRFSIVQVDDGKPMVGECCDCSDGGEYDMVWYVMWDMTYEGGPISYDMWW